jgi:5-methylcytosine-specific restriction endonuclease McrA
MEHRNCQECGAPFAPSRFAKRHDYCSDRCSAAAYLKSAPEQSCLYCVRPFRTRDKRGLGYCSKSCAVKAKRIGASCSLIGQSCDLVWKTCKCGSRFCKKGAKYCSVTCRRDADASYMRRYTRAKEIAKGTTFVTCRECGTVASARDTTGERWRSRSVYCSTPCMRRSVRREGKARRRQRKAGAGYQVVYRRRVYERDGWVCKLCGYPVPPDQSVPHPLAPTLDHIVPLSAGGEHSYRNVQLAHFRCNTLRGDRGL